MPTHKEQSMGLPIRDGGVPSGVKIPWARPSVSEKARQRVLEALDSNWISHGPFVKELEHRVANFCGVEHGIAVANGTVALHLALLCLDLKPEDEVIVPGFTFVAAANMVLAVGAKPVYVDVDPETWCLNAASVEKAITSRTKVICVVNLYGNVGDLHELRALADSAGLVLLEDNAEAFGTITGGAMAGSVGHIATLSFQATKTIATGEGGMVLTDSDNLCQKMILLRDHGMRKDLRYWHDIVGYNFRLTNLQAALGCAQLDDIEEIVADRRWIHQAYQTRLSQCPRFVAQSYRQGVDPVLWAFAGRILCERSSLEAIRSVRDACIQGLMAVGIETRPGFFALSSLPPYRGPELEVSSLLSASVISLPTYAGLKDSDIGYVCDNFMRVLSEARA